MKYSNASLKFVFALICMLTITSLRAQTNITTTIGSFNSSTCAVGDTIVLPITVNMASGISTAAISIDYDTTKLRCISAVTGLNSNISAGFLSNCGFFSNQSSNPPYTASSRRQFRAAWFNLAPVALNGLMFNLRFVVVATGNSSVKWDVATPGNCEYADELADVIPNCDFVNGIVTCGGTPPAQQSWSSPRIQVRFAEIPRPKLPARLVISDLEFSDRVGGNGNSILDAEEQVVVSFKLTNEGQGEAYKTRLNLKALHTFPGISYTPVQDLGDFKPGASQVFRVELGAARSIPTAEARFELNVSEGNGFDADPADLRFPTQAFKSPLLALADAVFSSKSGGNLVLGEPLVLDFVIQNRGQGVAKRVRLQVNRVNQPENIFVMGEEEFDLGNLAPNESKKLRYEFMTNKKYSLKEINLELVASEEYKEYGFRKVEKVGLDAILAVRQNLEVTGRKDAEIAITDVSLVSDVDRNIPYVEARNPHRYALIIGNEDYATYQVGIQTESNVAFARNDARSFKSYCERTLGVPAANIDFITDATAARTKQALDKLYRLIQAEEGKAEVLLYYAGHGLPLENTKEPYLIPVDVSGADPSMGISLPDMYTRLSQFPAKRVVVFLDACFSGGSRGTQLLAMRAVRIKADGAPVSGNLMVFSASSGEESALPWTEKQHGFFTYHLLKKLQETQGMVTYESLADYLRKEVRLQALKVSGKDQNPQHLASPDLNPEWKKWTIR